jgi:hypothetical protein
MAYNRKDAGGAREFYGNFLVNSQYSHKVYHAKSSAPEKATEFRPFASMHDDGSMAEQVAVVDGNPINGISDAFHCKEVVNWLGTKAYQMVTDTSDFPNKPSPTTIFYRKIQEFVEEEGKKARPEWAKWAEDRGPLKLPECKMLIQGVLLALDGAPCKDKAGNPVAITPVILILPKSATSSLEKSLVAPVDTSKPLSANNSVIGDITSPLNGHTIKLSIYKSADSFTKYNVVRGSPYPVPEDYMRKLVVNWNKLLRLETAAWQIARLVETFDAASVDYAFREDPDYGVFIPKIAQGAFEGRATVVVDDIPYKHPAPAPQPVYQAPAAPQAPAPRQYVQSVVANPPMPAPQTVMAPAGLPPLPSAENVMEVKVEDYEEAQPQTNAGRHYTPPTPPNNGSSTIMAALQEAKALALAKQK